MAHAQREWPEESLRARIATQEAEVARLRAAVEEAHKLLRFSAPDIEFDPETEHDWTQKRDRWLATHGRE